jgi:hypothetical protein
VTKFITTVVMILVTPKVAIKHKLISDSPKVYKVHLSTSFCSETDLLNKSSCLALALGVTKSHFAILLKSDLGVQQTHLSKFEASLLNIYVKLKLHNKVRPN